MNRHWDEATGQLLTTQQVAALVGVSTATVLRMVRSGRLPEPIRFNRKVVRWRRDDLVKWLERMAAG